MKPLCNKLNSSVSILIVLAVSILLSCGGGGDSTTAAPASLSYNGSTVKSVIDDSNAVDVASGAVNGGLRGNVFNEFAALAGASGSSDPQKYTVFFTAIMMQEAVIDLKGLSPSSIGSTRAVKTEENSIDGSCGGQATGSISIDDVTGDFWGDFNFSNFCESNVTLNGNTAFSGTIDLTTDEIENMMFDFSYLTGTESSGSFIIDGTLQLVNSPTGIVITMDMLLQESHSSDILWLNGYRMEVIDGPSNIAINVSGRYYDPHFGYVTLSTQENLILDDLGTFPSSGVLTAVGENGSAGGPTAAKLTCHASGLFQVEADTDGDGNYDWDSGILSWDDY